MYEKTLITEINEDHESTERIREIERRYDEFEKNGLW